MPVLKVKRNTGIVCVLIVMAVPVVSIPAPVTRVTSPFAMVSLVLDDLLSFALIAAAADADVR